MSHRLPRWARRFALLALIVSLILALPDSASAQPTAFPSGFGQGAIGGYYSFDEVVALLDGYSLAAPHIVSPKVAIGQSAEGRPIYAIRVSDQPTIDEAEPSVLIDALHHAREPLSLQTALLVLHRLVSGYGVDADVTRLVDERQIWFVPVVNPDGYVFNQVNWPQGGGGWRKNRRPQAGGAIGVDLNRNYSWQWAADDIGSSPDPVAETYRGPAPLSESETQAMHAFVATHAIDEVISLHAHGRKILVPFGYAAVEPAHGAEYAEQAAQLAQDNGYLAGPVHELLGLANGNAVDHHHAVFGARAWTLELGGEFWPSIPDMIETAELNVLPLLRLLRYAGAEVEPVAMQFAEMIGDGDGFIEPGETGGVALELRNRGIRATPGGVTMTLASLDGPAQITVGSALVPALAPFQSFAMPVGLRFQVDPGAPPGALLRLCLGVGVDAIPARHELRLDVGRPRLILHDDCEQERGWLLGQPGDDATTGIWTRADPLGVTQDGETVQPEVDVTAGGGKRCFVTGNNGTAPGLDDVDDGKTTLVSPRFDLSHTVGAHLRYHRFYWCSKVDDPLLIEISNDDGQSYVTLEKVLGRPNAWLAMDWRVADFIAPTAAMRLRCVASDPANDSVTEALIDELTIVDYGVIAHLGLLGTPQVGRTFELQATAPAGGAVWAFLSASAGNAPLAVAGVKGALVLDPAGLFLLVQAQAAADGLVRLVLPVPADPTLTGLGAWFQTLVWSPAPEWSNAVSIVLAPP